MVKLLFTILTTFLLLFALTQSQLTPEIKKELEPKPEPESEPDTANIFLSNEEPEPETKPEPQTFPDRVILDKGSLNTIPSRGVTLRPINQNTPVNPWIWRSGRRHGHRCRHSRHHRHLRHRHATWGGHEIPYGDDMIGNMNVDMLVGGGDMRRIPASWVKVRRERPVSFGTWYKLLRHEKKKKHAGGIFRSIRKFLNHL